MAINSWSVLLGTDRIRILPIIDQHKILEKRDAYSAKLVNLPYGTTAFELNDLLLQIKGKTCFIPRSPIKYNRQRFAIISFANKTDLATAMTSNFILRDTKLWWELPSSRPCKICFSKEHITTKCTYKNQKAHYFNQLNKLYENRAIDYRKPIITSPTLNHKKSVPIPTKKPNSSSSTTKNIQTTSSSSELTNDLTINKLNNDIKNLSSNLNNLTTKFEALELKLNQFLNNLEKPPTIPKMPIFADKSSQQSTSHNIPYIPLHPTTHKKSSPSENSNTITQLQLQIQEKDNEIINLKENNSHLNQQLSQLKDEQFTLFERMNQLELLLQHDSTQ
jgi:hypothetical protein